MPPVLIRIIFGAIAIPLALFFVFIGGPILRVFITLFLVGAGIEFYLITKEKNNPIILWISLIGIIFFCFRDIKASYIDFPGSDEYDFFLLQKLFFPVFFIIMFLIIIVNIIKSDPKKAIEKAGSTLFSIFYIGFLGSYLIKIPKLALHTQMDRFGLILLLITIWCSDSFAFFVGKYFGKRPLWPKLSPKKTYMGLLGSILGGVVGMLIGRSFFSPAFPSILFSILTGICLGIFGQVGDLFESLIKRSCNVKDSSNIFPGHGGILDRIDALLFCAPIFYYILKLKAFL